MNFGCFYLICLLTYIRGGVWTKLIRYYGHLHIFVLLFDSEKNCMCYNILYSLSETSLNMNNSRNSRKSKCVLFIAFNGLVDDVSFLIKFSCVYKYVFVQQYLINYNGLLIIIFRIFRLSSRLKCFYKALAYPSVSW